MYRCLDSVTRNLWTVDYTSLEDLKAFEKWAYDTGAPYAGGITLRRIWTEGGTLYEKNDNDLIGPVKLETLSEVVSQIIKKQAAQS